jgi:hypothetical protein
VTVSIAAETIGMCSSIFLVKSDFVDTSLRDLMSEYLGTKRTSSKVRASSSTKRANRSHR